MSAHDFLTQEFSLYLQDHQHPGNRATHFIGIPLIVSSLFAAPLLWDWRVLVAGQGIGWAFQLVGHRLEGNRPSLLKRPISLLMGPLMVMVEILEFLGLHFKFASEARALRQ